MVSRAERLARQARLDEVTALLLRSDGLDYYDELAPWERQLLGALQRNGITKIEDLTREKFLDHLCGNIAGDAAADFRKFLSDKADAFQNGLVMCGHDMGVYLDYRWLPESILPFADQAKNAYRNGGEGLDAAAEFLHNQVAGKGSDMFRKMVEQEYNRTKMEAAQFRSMYYQQSAMNCFGKAMNENDEQAAKTGCELLKQQIEAVKEASSYSRLAGYPEEWHYTGTRAPWAIREAEKKMEMYSRFTAI